MPGSNGPLHIAEVRIGCRSNSLPAAFGSVAEDRSTDGLYGCESRLDIGGNHQDRRTDQSTAADDLARRDLRARTHRTVPLAPTVSVPASPNLLFNMRIESADEPAIWEEFFNRISPM